MRKEDHALFEDIDFFQDTRLSVINKFSFAAYHSILGKISSNMKAFTECQKYIYNKHAICFLWDFCQLEAIGGDCIYKNQNGIYWEQALTCMVELKGTHCFNNCVNMKTIMPNMRDGGVLSTEERKTLIPVSSMERKSRNQIR
jgi:cAMP phosphodiesterase